MDYDHHHHHQRHYAKPETSFNCGSQESGAIITASVSSLSKPFTEPLVRGHLKWILIFSSTSALTHVTLPHSSQGVFNEQKGVPGVRNTLSLGVISHTAIDNTYIRALRTSVIAPMLSVPQGTLL